MGDLTREEQKAASVQRKSLEKRAEVCLKGKAPDNEAAAVFSELLAFYDAYRHSETVQTQYIHTLISRMYQEVRKNPDGFPLWYEAADALDERNRQAELLKAEAAESKRLERVEQNRESKKSRLLMTTTPRIDHRETLDVLGVVTGSCAMSRNALSDLGSDVKTTFGGRLGGIETAVLNAHKEAERHLEEAALELGADAVVGINLSVQTVADKAQLVMLMGTAVLLRDAEGSVRESPDS